MGHLVGLGDSVKCCLLLLFCGFLTGQDFIVVTSADSPFQELSKDQLRMIFLGQLDRLEGVSVRGVFSKSEPQLQANFEDFVFGRHFDFGAYRLTQKLQQGQDIVLEVRTWVLVLAFVARNPGWIGYIESTRLSELQAHKLVVCHIKP